MNEPRHFAPDARDHGARRNDSLRDGAPQGLLQASIERGRAFCFQASLALQMIDQPLDLCAFCRFGAAGILVGREGRRHAAPDIFRQRRPAAQWTDQETQGHGITKTPGKAAFPPVPALLEWAGSQRHVHIAATQRRNVVLA